MDGRTESFAITDPDPEAAQVGVEPEEGKFRQSPDTRTPQADVPLMREIDAGPVTIPETLPPAYQNAWAFGS